MLGLNNFSIKFSKYFMRGVLICCFSLLSLLMWGNNPVVQKTTRGIELINSQAKMVLSEKAELLSLIDLASNFDIAPKNHPIIANVKNLNGIIIEASKLSLIENCLLLTIGRYQVKLKVEVFNDYFTFEVLNHNLSDVDELSFISLKLTNNTSKTDLFTASGVALTLHTDPLYIPSCENKEVIAKCYSHTGINGAKLAVVACKKDKFWDIVRSVYRSLPPHSVPVALSSGGPFGVEGPANRNDCVIIGGEEVTPNKVNEWINFYSKLGIKQIQLYLGQYTFTQGQFDFPVLGSASSFKEHISKPLDSAGIISTLHTYSYYISYSSNEILSNPKWQQQLEYRAEYVLSKDITDDDAFISVKGDLSVITLPGYYYSVFTPYILIDNELIRYSVGKNGFENCRRGQCGTEAKRHKKGAKVRVIGGYYNYMVPQIGSELFFEIARRTAAVYNEGGFRGFYFDAFDGLGRHLKYLGLEKYHWFYGAAFINEVLKYCKQEPLVLEASHLFPTVWTSRGRGECWDTPCRGYKNFVDDHINRNKSLMNRQYVGTLGWFDFFPQNIKQPGNFSTKYLLSDDIDYLGAKAIAYDQTMVYDGLLKMDVESNHGLKSNLGIFSQYTNLRQNNYFSDRVKNVLKDGRYEYRLIKRKGIWGFDESVYCRSKIRDIDKDLLVAINPFKKQKPFIRLENLYSSDGNSDINLIKFNDSIDLNSQKLKKNYSTPIDLSEHIGIKISLKGNGVKSKDALCIRLQSLNQSGYADYIVRLNFEGWRDVIMPNLDNAEYSDLHFVGMEDDHYRMHRFDVDYSQINSVKVFKAGSCEGVIVKSIDAVPIVQNPISNPVVKLNGASVTFVDTIQSGEYVEYNAGSKTALVFDRYGNNRRINVKRNKQFVVPKGEFSASVSGTSSLKGVPSEVVLTFGLYGKFIHN